MKTIDLIKMLLETGDLNKPITFYTCERGEVGSKIEHVKVRGMYNTIGSLSLELVQEEVKE